ncbi:putative serine peptidase [Halenospora varia]|nr:putative serine peptidase [Halenospora varia]
MISFFVAAVSALSLASSSYANLAGPARPPISQEAVQTASLLPRSSTGSSTFKQFIDHNNPSLGAFTQRYWYNTEFWNGPGSPVIIFNPGEVPVLGPNGDFTGYLYNTTLIGQYAQAVGGAAIVVEHRYWGESSPYTDLTSENLTFLTVPQAVQDMTNFARSVPLPFDTTGKTNAPNSPWVLVGGSYSGSLAAWTEITAPGTFWAYHASSAPVQAIENFWEYFQPIQQGIPKACSNDIIAVISHVDTVLATGTDTDKQALKTMFGLGTVVHDADFARTLTLPLDLWQEGIPQFMVFCEALEGVPGGQVSPTSNGIGLDAALPNFASYIASTRGCSAPDCYDSYNANQFWYTDTTLDTGVIAGRQWWWMLCNEAFGFWQTGAPAGMDSLVSRLVTADYYQRQCNLYFPGVEFGLNEDAHNAEYMGWNIEGTTRVMFSSGEFDPWRSAGVSSEFRPGGPMVSTSDIPIFIVPGGIHTQDLSNPDATPEIAALQVQEVAQMKRWIATVTSSSSSHIIASNSTIYSVRSSKTFVPSGIRSSS